MTWLGKIATGRSKGKRPFRVSMAQETKCSRESSGEFKRTGSSKNAK
jgi:hypothetical protein